MMLWAGLLEVPVKGEQAKECDPARQWEYQHQDRNSEDSTTPATSFPKN
jgi:hypothetical protein